MKLSNKTLNILTNFASFQPNIFFESGKVLATVDDYNKILAVASIDDDITEEFGIYNLNEFLSTLDLFKNPVIEVCESDGAKVITLTSEDTNTIAEYTCADPDILTIPPAKSIKIPQSDENIMFELKSDTLTELQKAASVLGADRLCVSKKGGATTISVRKSDGTTKNKYSIDLPDVTTSLENIDVQFELPCIKVLSADYDVLIAPSGASYWKSSSVNVEYWIASEVNN